MIKTLIDYCVTLFKEITLSLSLIHIQRETNQTQTNKIIYECEI